MSAGTLEHALGAIARRRERGSAGADAANDPLGALVSRSKIMVEADIAERRRRQDHRIVFEDPATGSLTDLRASSPCTASAPCRACSTRPTASSSPSTSA